MGTDQVVFEGGRGGSDRCAWPEATSSEVTESDPDGVPLGTRMRSRKLGGDFTY